MTIAVVTTGYHAVALPEGYQYLEVGCSRREDHIKGALHDDSGDQISQKNDTYCELTGLYWLWKNCEDPIRGLCHYRRFFSRDDTVGLFSIRMERERRIAELMLTEEQIQEFLQHHDLVLLMPIDPADHTVREDLLRFVSEEDLKILDELILQFCPQYQNVYQQILQCRNVSYCNMFIAKRQVFDGYCEFLFPLLKAYEKRIDMTGYSSQQRRLFGYVAEVLLNVYVAGEHLKPKYVNMLAVAECYGNTAAQRLLYREYSAIMRVSDTAPFRAVYRIYFAHRYPGRYKNLLELSYRLREGGYLFGDGNV